MSQPGENRDQPYIEALETAIAEFRAMSQELDAKAARWLRLRTAIVTLSNHFGREIPADVLTACDRRTVGAKVAIRIGKQTRSQR